MLRLSEPRERLGPDALQPGSAYEEPAEPDGENREKEPDPSVDKTAHAGS